MSITPLDGPKLIGLLQAAERQYRATLDSYGPELTRVIADREIESVAEDNVTSQTAGLLALALDTPSLMFEEPEVDTTTPFGCLWQAVVERIEEHLIDVRDAVFTQRLLAREYGGSLDQLELAGQEDA
jgi:hypothetical protein